MVEFDVHTTSDGGLVICTTNAGPLHRWHGIEEMTLEQVRSLDAGSRSLRSSQARRCRRSEAIAALPAPIWLNIHLKTVDAACSLGFGGAVHGEPACVSRTVRT